MSGYLKNIIKESEISELTIAQKLNIDILTLKLWEEGAYPQKIEHLNIPKWRSHLIRQNRATYSNLENHLIQITEPGNPI